MATIGDQMRLDLARAGYSAGTQRVYWADARALVKRFMKPPTEIGREELRMYVEELYGMLCTSPVLPRRAVRAHRLWHE